MTKFRLGSESRINPRRGGRNGRLASSVPAWQLATVGVLISLWIGLSALLVVTRGQPEAFLAADLGHSVGLMPSRI